MNEASTLHRLRLPAILSGIGLLVTQIIYQCNMTRSPTKEIGLTPLAKLDSRIDVIERRPTTRIIWETLREGDDLFSGEAVRTSPKASGKITFVKSGLTLGLEPDSLVIIEEEKGKLQLNLINGGVFVKNESGDAGKASKSAFMTNQPVIKAGDKKIELNQSKSSEMNLSMSESGAANISVTKGDIKLADQSGKTQKLSEGDIKLLSSDSKIELIDAGGPAPGASIPMTGSSDLLEITWLKAPQGSTIFLELGTTRESLNRISTKVPATAGKISAQLPIGYFFWQIVAERDGKVVGRSPATFNQSVVLEAPKLLTNASGEKIVLKSDQKSTNVYLSWTKPAGAEVTTIFVSKDKNFKIFDLSKSFTSETEWSESLNEPGIYYWKVNAVWRGIATRINSKVGSFTITKEKEVPPPVIDPSLLNREYPKLQTDEDGLNLSWKGPQGIESYIFRLSFDGAAGNKELILKEITGTQFRLSNLPAGTYRWSVSSKIGQVETKTPASARFKIIETARLKLVDKTLNQDKIEFVSNQFRYTSSITNVPSTASLTRYKLLRSDDSGSNWTKSNSKEILTFTVPSPGLYKLFIEALDTKDKVIGTSGPIQLQFTEPKLLSSPELIGGSKNLIASELGEINLKWKPVSGASKYLLQLSGPKTKLRRETAGISLLLSGMFPGTHQLILTAIDSNGRPGKPGTPVFITVPDVSSIAAPSVKGLKVR